ncbi:unnamed protein product, partial [Heterosigma akashiwo]
MLQEKEWISFAVLSMFVTQTIALTIPKLAGEIVDQLMGEHQDQKVFNWAVFRLGIAATVRATTYSLQRYSYILVGEKLVNRLRNMVFESILSRDI